jgi:ATP phosphoribosyltransferase
MLKVAFGKGRGASDCIQVLDESAPEEFRQAKRLQYHSQALDLEGVLVRNSDLPFYLREGLVDVAVGSELVFNEHTQDDSRLVLVAPLEVSVCRLSLISSDQRPFTRFERVASRYVRTARHLLLGLGLAPEILPLAGSVEVALHLGACDAIVDIVETGNTIRKLGLLERQVLHRVRHGIWIHRDNPNALRRLRELAPGLNYLDQDAEHPLRDCG